MSQITPTVGMNDIASFHQFCQRNPMLEKCRPVHLIFRALQRIFLKIFSKPNQFPQKCGIVTFLLCWHFLSMLCFSYWLVIVVDIGHQCHQQGCRQNMKICCRKDHGNNDKDSKQLGRLAQHCTLLKSDHLFSWGLAAPNLQGDTG